MNRLLLAFAMLIVLSIGIYIGAAMHPIAWAQQASPKKITMDQEYIPNVGQQPYPGVPVYGWNMPPRWQVIILPTPGGNGGTNRSMVVLLDSLTGETFYLNFNQTFYWARITH